MKKIFVLLLALLVLAGCSNTANQNETVQETSAAETSEATSNDETLNVLDIFAQNPQAFNGLETGNFSKNVEDAPTDEELTTMFNFANSIGTAHKLTAPHFIVIRDYEKQKSLFKTFGENCVSEGTVTVLVQADVLRDQEYHDEAYNDWYSQMYYGIFDAGQESSYLNLAANALGYKTHFYAALDIPVDGEININNGGNFDLITTDNWDIEKYLTSKDGSVEFGHTVGTYSMPDNSKEIKAEGNLNLLCVIVVGKLDESTDLTTAATNSYKPANYNFWEPQDGSSYGNIYDESANEAIWAQLPDGTYSGSASSTSSEYTIEATIESGQIVNIEITSGAEDMYGDQDSIDQYLQSIIDQQSLNVDTISGATQDCNGIAEALKQAFSVE